MSKRPNQQQVIVRMDPEMHAAIKERAAAEDRSMAQTIRYALRLYLDTGATSRQEPTT